MDHEMAFGDVDLVNYVLHVQRGGILFVSISVSFSLPTQAVILLDAQFIQCCRRMLTLFC